jgi:hypothetical protein
MHDPETELKKLSVHRPSPQLDERIERLGTAHRPESSGEIRRRRVAIAGATAVIATSFCVGFVTGRTTVPAATETGPRGAAVANVEERNDSGSDAATTREQALPVQEAGSPVSEVASNEPPRLSAAMLDELITRAGALNPELGEPPPRFVPPTGVLNVRELSGERYE